MTTEILTHAKFTIDEYHQMIELGLLDDKNVELLKGEIVEMVPEGPEHSDPSDNGHEYLLILLGDRARVRSAKPITLPNRSEPEPDIAVCERREYRSHHPYPENIFWVIEYSNSSLRKDREIKRKIYAEAGIVEYWIVNVQTNELTVMREPEYGDYQTEFKLASGVIQPVAFPNLSIEVLKIVNP